MKGARGANWSLAACVLGVTLASVGRGDAPDAPPIADALADKQRLIERRYKEFEAVLDRMAGLLEPTDPDRAALAKKAFAESKRRLVTLQLERLVETLRDGDLSGAVKDQSSVRDDLEDLLDLLLSEDRLRRLAAERERLQRQLAAVKKLRREQAQLRGQTERAPADAPDRLAQQLARRQGQLAQDARELAEKMTPKMSSGSAEGSGKPAGGEPGESENRPDDQEDGAPARRNLEKAEQAMKSAREKLQNLQTEKATADQEEAIRELEETIAELEEILRQLREEERLALLTSLEARFRTMLQMQKIVYEGTVRLDRVPAGERTRVDRQQSLQLADRQRELLVEVEQALLVLRDDGTSVALVAVVEQVQGDVELVAGLLDRFQVDAFTQNVETGILEALEELIGALEREIENAKDPQKGQPGSGGDGANPLVDMLAELRMIRSLQFRVNQRTDQLAGKLENAPSDELTRAILELAERQARIYAITRQIVLDANR